MDELKYWTQLLVDWDRLDVLSFYLKHNIFKVSTHEDEYGEFKTMTEQDILNGLVSCGIVIEKRSIVKNE